MIITLRKRKRMKEQPFRQDKEEIQELLKQYNNLRAGKSYSFLEEDAFERIIDYYDENDDFVKALEVVETGLEYFPYSSHLLIKYADLLIVTRRYHESLKILERAELFDSADINIPILKTDAYLALDQQDKAVIVLEEALAYFDGEDRQELLFELADVYDDYEEFDKVFDCLKMILEEDLTNEEALYKICFWTDFTGRNEESIKLHQHIINEHPYSELAWFNLGAAYQGIKLYEKAVDAYQYAVTVDEKFDYAYRNMGDAYIRLRMYKEAIEVLQKVVELTRPEEVIFEAIGHCFHRLSNYAQARFHYRKASHMNPDDSKLYYKIALTYINEQQWEHAIKQLDHAMRIQRNVAEYNLAMGECRMNVQQYREAIHHFGLVIKQRPRNVNGWESLIKCLHKKESFAEASEQCLAALQATEGKPVFLFYYAASLIGDGRWKEALLQLEKAMEKAPKLLKKFIELNPSVLQKAQVVDIIARYKKRK